MEFEAVVFDLGGVVIDLERQRCIDAFRSLGFTDVEQYLDQYTQRGAFFLLETGAITAAAFYDRLRPLCPLAKCDVDIQDAFNKFLVKLPVERLDALRSLKEKCKVFALSNTNPVMYNSWICDAFRQQGMHIDDYFHGIIASFREGCCKPDRRIFHILMERYGLDSKRTLYLDDSENNCIAAAETGLRTEHVTPDNSMLHIVSKLF